MQGSFVHSSGCTPLVAFLMFSFAPQVSHAGTVEADSAQELGYSTRIAKHYVAYKKDASSDPQKIDGYMATVVGVTTKLLGATGIPPFDLIPMQKAAIDHFLSRAQYLTPQQQKDFAIKFLKDYAAFLPPIAKEAANIAIDTADFELTVELNKFNAANGSNLQRSAVIAQVQESNVYQQAINNYYITVLSEAHKIAKTNNTYAANFDAIFQSDAGVSIKASTQAMYSGLNLPDYFVTSINADGSMNVDVGGLKLVYRDQSQKVNDTTSQSINMSKLIHNAQRLSLLTGKPASEILASVSPDLKGQAKLQYLVNKETITTARAAIGLASTLSAFFDAKTSKDIATFGGATVQIADAVNELAVGEVGVSGAMLATGNIAGAVLSIYGALSGGPSQDEIMREQLQVLGKKIDQLRTEMHERFDMVDSKLNTILDTINSNFNVVIPQLDLVISRLADLQANLDRFERNLYDLEVSGFLASLDKAITDCIAFRQVNNSNLSQTAFSDCKSTFYLWATQNARTLATIPGNRAYDDDNLYKELSKSVANPDLDFFIDSANINYLRLYPQQRFGLSPLSFTALPNPSVWAIATRAFLQLAKENPAYAVRANSIELEDVYDVGRTVQQAVSNITTPRQPATQLFTSLTANYSNQASSLAAGTANIENSWTRSYAQSISTRLIGSLRLNGCGGQSLNLALPNSTFNGTDPVFLVADQLRGRPGISGQISVCISTSRVTSNLVNVDINAFYAGTKVSTLRVQVTYSGDLDAFWSLIVSNWTDRTVLKEYFEGTRSDSVSFSQFVYPCGRRGDVCCFCDPAFAPFQSSIAQAINSDAYFLKKLSCNTVDSFNTANTAPAALEVQQAANRLAGAKAALEKYLLMGMPQTLQNNDYLRLLIYGSLNLPGRDTSGFDEVVTKVYGPVILGATDAGFTGTVAAACANPQISNAKVERVNLNLVLENRLANLQSTVENALNQINQTPTSEGNDVINSTLTAIQEFLDAKKASEVPTSTGSNILVKTAQSVQVTFPSVFQPGVTIAAEVEPGAASGVPGGFVIGGVSWATVLAYAVETSAIYGGPVTTCFTVSSVNDATAFQGLTIFHYEAAGWIDRTSIRDFATRKICSSTPTLSPFAVAMKVVMTGPQPQIVVSRTVARDVAGNQVVVHVDIKNQAGGSAQNLQITVGRINTTSGGALPQIIGTLGISGTTSATLRFPANVGLPGTAAVLTIGGTYTGGSFNSATRIIIP